MSTEAASVRIISVALRVLLVFVAYASLLVATAGLVATAERVAAPGAVPFERESLLGLPVVALASAGLTSFLILRSRFSGSRLALRIGLTFFGAHTLLPELDAFGWRQTLPRGAVSVAVSLFAGAVFATMLASSAVVILGRTGPAREVIHAPRASARAIVGLALDLASAAAAYVAIYFGLGCSTGWYDAAPGSAGGESGLLCLGRSATLLAAMPQLWWVEAVRGCVWALVALTIARMLRGSVIEAAVALGAFAALAGPVHSLLPNPALLGHAGAGHSLVVLMSHFAWGVLLAFWLSRAAPSVDASHAKGHVG